MPSAATLWVIACHRCGYAKIKIGQPRRPRACSECNASGAWDLYTIAAIPADPGRPSDSRQRRLADAEAPTTPEGRH